MFYSSQIIIIFFICMGGDFPDYKKQFISDFDFLFQLLIYPGISIRIVDFCIFYCETFIENVYYIVKINQPVILYY